MPNADLGNPNFFKTFLGRFEAELPDGGRTPVMLTAMNELCLMQDLTADSTGLIMTLPEKCRPKNPVRFACVVEKSESRKTAVTVSRQVGTTKGSVQDGNSWAARRKGWVKASVQVDTVQASVQTDTAKASVKTGTKSVNNPPSASSGMSAGGYDGYSTSAVEVPVLSDVNVPVLESIEVPVMADVNVPTLDAVEVPLLRDVDIPVLENVTLDLEAGNTPETVVTVNPDGRVLGMPSAMHRLNGRSFYVIDRYYL